MTGKRPLDSPEMQQDTPSKSARNDKPDILDQDNEEYSQRTETPWIEVRSRRKNALQRNTSDDYPTTKFRLQSWNGHENSYQAIKAMEREHPTLNIRVRQNLQGLYIIRPVDENSEEIMKTVARESPGIEPLEGHTREVKAIVMNYPIQQVLDPLKEHEAITSAGRCTAGREKRETRQVVVTYLGPLPDYIDLGTFGRYGIRKFEKEPLRCFKCQRFGHHKTRCTYTVRCGVCSQDHDTDECLRRHKNGGSTQARCPNCSRNHHVWFRKCPERLRRIKGSLPKEDHKKQSLPDSRKEIPQQRPLSPTRRAPREEKPPSTPRRQGCNNNNRTRNQGRPTSKRQQTPRTPKQNYNRRYKRQEPSPTRRQAHRTPRSQTEQRPNSPTQRQLFTKAPKTPRQQDQEPWPPLPDSGTQDKVTISKADLGAAVTKIVEGLAALSTLDTPTLRDAVNQIVKSALGVQSPKAQTNLNKLYSQTMVPTTTHHSTRDPRLNRSETTETNDTMDDDDLPSLTPIQKT